jgi:hypothetical protein
VAVSVAFVFDSTTTQALTVALHTANAVIGRALRHMLRLIADGARRFTEAHHLRWWRQGGTDLVNLALVCSFHHRLVHEHGWSVRREATGDLLWRRPDGTRYESGPSPGYESGPSPGSSLDLMQAI